MNSKKIPAPTVGRLSIYLKCFSELSVSGVDYASSGHVAKLMGLNPAQVRKDLAYFGKFGRRGYGYSVESLKENISKILGTHKEWKVGVIGAGNLGSALLMYGGFMNRGFKIAAGFDVDPAKLGWELNNVRIFHIDELENVIKREKLEIVIITTPKDAITGVVERLKKTRIKGVLNFAGRHLISADDFVVRNVDLALEMEQLTFFITNKDGVLKEGSAGEKDE
ncbi:MAG TPA: redox-sensing transcriptional repressor Rex [bacterium]|nr:redox-sensing transcriptional repressor Rex [bacterium]